MTRRTTKPAVTAMELKARFDDWKKKERRFKAISTGKRAFPESQIDSAATDAQAAFNVVYKLLLQHDRRQK